MAKRMKTAKPRRSGVPSSGKPLATNANMRRKIMARLMENPALTVEDMALELKISRQRAQAYMTPGLRAEVERLRVEVEDPSLDEIDRAMRRQARLGNVQAARLVYMRMAQKGDMAAVPTLEELEAELANLKQCEQNKGETRDDENVDAAAAVADVARR